MKEIEGKQTRTALQDNPYEVTQALRCNKKRCAFSMNGRCHKSGTEYIYIFIYNKTDIALATAPLIWSTGVWTILGYLPYLDHRTFFGLVGVCVCFL